MDPTKSLYKINITKEKGQGKYKQNLPHLFLYTADKYLHVNHVIFHVQIPCTITVKNHVNNIL